MDIVLGAGVLASAALAFFMSACASGSWKAERELKAPHISSALFAASALCCVYLCVNLTLWIINR
jgi:hypothetical protein